MLFLYKMVTVDINVFRKNLKKYLATPCQVTRYGIVITSIIPTGKSSEPETPETKDTIDLTPKDPTPLGTKKVETTYATSVFHNFYLDGKKVRLCEHGELSGTCPSGCKEK